MVSRPEIAVALQQRTTEMGVAIPEQLSILAASDSLPCGLPIRGITSIVQPFREMGYQAARLIHRMTHHPGFVANSIELPVDQVPETKTVNYTVCVPTQVQKEVSVCRTIVVPQVVEVPVSTGCSVVPTSPCGASNGCGQTSGCGQSVGCEGGCGSAAPVSTGCGC